MGCMAERVGHQLAASQLVVLRDQLESYLTVPRLRASIVADETGADLDAAVSAALTHLDEARRLLAPFFVQKYGLGDLVDVFAVNERTGEEFIELEAATVVEIRGEGPFPTTVVEDRGGDRLLIAGRVVRQARR